MTVAIATALRTVITEPPSRIEDALATFDFEYGT
jgi:hypothetical protein